MATLADPRSSSGDTAFFAKMSIVMAVVLVAGFSLNLAAGRSSFAVPPLFHVHAFVFFSWVGLYVTQSLLAGRGGLALHRRLGWLAVLFIPVMIVLGVGLTIYSMRLRGAPFFFDENEFLLGNPLGILTFGGLAASGLVLRRRTQWHRRLMYCAMASLTGPGFGRLLPMPLLVPWSWWVAALIMPFTFPVIGIAADLRRAGQIHPAWWWGAGAMICAFLVGETIAYSPVGYALTHWVVDDTPGGLRPIGAFKP